MKKIVSIEYDLPKVDNSILEGLAPVVCYEPWFPRCLEAIKQCLSDGFPVLLRFHSAASYPNAPDDGYKMDLESHAVLIVGYDDEKQSVAIVDPWNNNWGGELGGRRWMTYADISRPTVNTSLGMAMCLTPLQVQLISQCDENKNLSIAADIGFYSPRGVVMDRESWAIKKVMVECESPEACGSTIHYELDGHWIVGDHIKLSMPLTSKPECKVKAKVHIKAIVQGKRPYEFSDVIKISKNILIDVEALNNEICNYIAI